MMTSDVVVIGGGIIGASAAALLAEAGQSVTLVEERSIAAGASGRNSGALQHPFHPLLAQLHEASLRLYHDLAARDDGFEMAPSPAGLLLLGADADRLAERASRLAELTPELAPSLLDPARLRALEPSLADGLWAVRLATGYPVRPAAATLAFAARAERAGARILLGAGARPLVAGGLVVGTRLATGERLACRQVLVAAGPWTPSVVAGWEADPPIVSSWGLVAATRLPQPPTAILEEFDIDAGGWVDSAAFSLVTATGTSTVGSTFLPAPPDADTVAAAVMARAARFVPDLRTAGIESIRVCARPVSFDGLPLAGPVPAVDGLFVCAGHGPWGISTGPGTASLVVDLMLGRQRAADEDVLSGLVPERFAARRDMQAGTSAGDR